jgi:uncharacterized cupredoxin-like copper-binding protein
MLQEIEHRSEMKDVNGMRTLKVLAMLGLATALLAGCASAAAAPRPGQTALDAGTVHATLSDNMKIAVDKTSVPAGLVTFIVKNSGAVVHELVILQTDVAEDKVAADADEAGKMDETGNVGETGDMKAGEGKTFTVTLPAGHYVLMCNEIGHYTSGMHLTFTVK